MKMYYAELILEKREKSWIIRPLRKKVLPSKFLGLLLTDLKKEFDIYSCESIKRWGKVTTCCEKIEAPIDIEYGICDVNLSQQYEREAIYKTMSIEEYRELHLYYDYNEIFAFPFGTKISSPLQGKKGLDDLKKLALFITADPDGDSILLIEKMEKCVAKIVERCIEQYNTSISLAYPLSNLLNSTHV